jgi:hypothetical protein
MIELIITSSDKLYAILSEQTRAKGHIPRRARDVLQGFEYASRLGRTRANPAAPDALSPDALTGIIVDMSLHAADTLIETLHSRPSTSGVPLVAVKCDGQIIPLALRRLCSDVLQLDGSAPVEEQTTGKP